MSDAFEKPGLGRPEWRLLPLLLFALLAANCGLFDELEEQLHSVETVDDQAAASSGFPIVIAVLANDNQDDDLVTSFSQGRESDGTVQPGSVVNTSNFYPDKLTYTSPTGFEGTVTFQYTITGLGLSYEFESVDTGTVTVVVTEGLPPVVAVNDHYQTLIDTPIVLDVLLNDTQDSDAIDSIRGLLAADGTADIIVDGREKIEFTPAPGRTNDVFFFYDIVSAGISNAIGSEDTATVRVEILPPPSTVTVQFDDASLEGIESITYFVGQDAIDADTPTTEVFETGATTPCFEVDAGVNVALLTQIFPLAGPPIDAAGVCGELVAAEEYTIRVRNGPFETVCLEGLTQPSLCP